MKGWTEKDQNRKKQTKRNKIRQFRHGLANNGKI